MMPREPDRFEAKARELWHSLRTDTVQAVPAIAAALRRERDETLREVQRLGSTEWIAAELYRSALASPAAAPGWMPPRDAMTGMTAAEEMRAAGIDVLRGARPAAAPAAEECEANPDHCEKWHNHAPPSEPAAPARGTEGPGQCNDLPDCDAAYARIAKLEAELTDERGKIAMLRWHMGTLVDFAEAFLADPENESVAEQFAAELASKRTAVEFWKKQR